MKISLHVKGSLTDRVCGCGLDPLVFGHECVHAPVPAFWRTETNGYTHERNRAGWEFTSPHGGKIIFRFTDSALT